MRSFRAVEREIVGRGLLNGLSLIGMMREAMMAQSRARKLEAVRAIEFGLLEVGDELWQLMENEMTGFWFQNWIDQ
jgi:hypothetical protein